MNLPYHVNGFFQQAFSNIKYQIINYIHSASKWMTLLIVLQRHKFPGLIVALALAQGHSVYLHD